MNNVNVSTPNDGLGNKLRDAFVIVNENFSELLDLISGSISQSELDDLETSVNTSFDAIYSILDTKSDNGHTHIISNITGLTTALNQLVQITDFNNSVSNINNLISIINATLLDIQNQLDAIGTDINDLTNTVDSHISDTANPHDVTKSQVGLSNVDNTSDINKPISTATQTALDLKASITYVDGLVVGLLDDRGSYNASSNLYPSSGGSGTSGAIKKGDIWYVSVAGTLGGSAVNIGDSFRALVDTPGQTASNWSSLEANIGYVPANDNNVVHLSGDQTVAGKKTFSSNVINDSGNIVYFNLADSFYQILKSDHHIPLVVTDENDNKSFSVLEQSGIAMNKDNDIEGQIRVANLTVTRSVELPDADGTIALTSNITSATQSLYNSIVKQTITSGITTSCPSQNVVYNTLALKEVLSNKSTITTLGTSNTLYPSQNAVKVYADNKVVQTITNGITASAPSQDAVFDALSLKANNDNVVHLSGDEGIDDKKTFNNRTEFVDGLDVYDSAGGDFATLKGIDSGFGIYYAGEPLLTLEQSGFLTLPNTSTSSMLLNYSGLTGSKSFIVPNQSGTLALSENTVNLTGNQTVNGNKSFSNGVAMNNGVYINQQVGDNDSTISMQFGDLSMSNFDATGGSILNLVGTSGVFIKASGTYSHPGSDGVYLRTDKVPALRTFQFPNTNGTLAVSENTVNLDGNQFIDNEKTFTSLFANNNFRLQDITAGDYGAFELDEDQLSFYSSPNSPYVGSQYAVFRIGNSILQMSSSLTDTLTLSSGPITGAKNQNFINANGAISIIGTTAPASASATGVMGEIRITSTFIYTCIAANTWVRSPAATW